MTASRIKDEPLLPVGMEDHLGQSFSFQNQRKSTLNIQWHKTIWVVRMLCKWMCEDVSDRVWYNVR